ISHVSVRNKMDFFHEPYTFAALCVKGAEGNVAKVLEGPVPDWKIFGMPRTGRGADRSNYGLPRFDKASFLARFPFGTVTLRDAEIPMSVKIVGWSPFTPGDPDNSSLPVGALEYRFENTSDEAVEAVFSYNTKNFMAIGGNTHFRGAAGNGVRDIENGFVLWQKEADDHPEYKGTFAIFTDDDATVVDHCWFKGGWWDPATLAWKNIQEARLVDNPPSDSACPGASLFVPFRLAPGEKKLVKLMFCWYVPNTTTRHGQDAPEGTEPCEGEDCCPTSQTYIPWYAGRFKDIDAVATYWRESYRNLRRKSDAFRRAFYDTTLPKEVVEAVAANLTILKSPTVLRQANGKLWCYEGCNDDSGCCHGSCTHVWNYAQAICHLFPSLERSLRQTEFTCSQDKRGHQTFRSNLPIRPVAHTWHAASDGQLGGIMKVYRDWRISGDTVWLKSLWPNVKQSLEYCIQAWDPRGRGVLEEPHHNTYDIEYWGPDGHCSSFYLGALTAAIEMGQALDDDVSRYRDLVSKGREFLETKLHNGEYFYHKVQTEGLNATFRPLDTSANGPGYNAIIATLNEQGPKYQYGTGCLSDGVLGFWIARACGLEKDIVDADKVRSNLRAIHKYNLKHDLSDHSNPQRPSYAVGKEGGLLLCTWPRGGKPALPFVYSDEVWTGIEYQVASHLMMEGLVDEGLEIVRACRDRYDGRVRNPFNEYECGHWYARAMSSYGLIQGLTGVRYDAVDKTLHIDSKMGKDFRAFLSTATGFGTVGLEGGKPFLEVRTGRINVRRTLVSGKEMSL
ncbi:MAG: GH116 family glycosyl hydrolase, partial [Planctomycetota bacterium]